VTKAARPPGALISDVIGSYVDLLEIVISWGIQMLRAKMYFPKIFAFVGGDPSEDDTPISCLYTLDPRAVSLIEGVRVVPIDRIDETCQRHNRAKSLILRHTCSETTKMSSIKRIAFRAPAR
jgi:hypothetical protein